IGLAIALNSLWLLLTLVPFALYRAQELLGREPAIRLLSIPKRPRRSLRSINHGEAITRIAASQGMICGSAKDPRAKVGRSHKLMPKSDPKDLCPPAKYKPRRGARPLSATEIK